ncbi:MAG: GNAT family N-acetyltransferase [Anaerolineales bacterium]|nr:GNAT family N-acetyltransferase [Anaerolineales bacterium]
MIDQNAPTIRPAVPEEAPMLTALTLRSKAHWGYDDGFMSAAVAELTITPDYILQHAVFLLQIADDILGYVSLVDQGEELLLDNLFIEPEHIGIGYGRMLWQRAVDYARQAGYQSIILVADPNAAPIYTRLGAVQYGEEASNIQTGRMLPKMRFAL